MSTLTLANLIKMAQAHAVDGFTIIGEVKGLANNIAIIRKGENCWIEDTFYPGRVIWTNTLAKEGLYQEAYKGYGNLKYLLEGECFITMKQIGDMWDKDLRVTVPKRMIAVCHARSNWEQLTYSVIWADTKAARRVIKAGR